jgi:hypothetical protein
VAVHDTCMELRSKESLLNFALLTAEGQLQLLPNFRSRYLSAGLTLKLEAADITLWVGIPSKPLA